MHHSSAVAVKIMRGRPVCRKLQAAARRGLGRCRKPASGRAAGVPVDDGCIEAGEQQRERKLPSIKSWLRMGRSRQTVEKAREKIAGHSPKNGALRSGVTPKMVLFEVV